MYDIMMRSWFLYSITCLKLENKRKLGTYLISALFASAEEFKYYFAFQRGSEKASM